MYLGSRFPSKLAASSTYANDDDVVICAAYVVRYHPRSPSPCPYHAHGGHVRLHCALATPRAAAAVPEQVPRLYSTVEHLVFTWHFTNPQRGDSPHGNIHSHRLASVDVLPGCELRYRTESLDHGYGLSEWRISS